MSSLSSLAPICRMVGDVAPLLDPTEPPLTPGMGGKKLPEGKYMVRGCV